VFHFINTQMVKAICVIDLFQMSDFMMSNETTSRITKVTNYNIAILMLKNAAYTLSYYIYIYINILFNIISLFTNPSPVKPFKQVVQLKFCKVFNSHFVILIVNYTLYFFGT
jgi:hypothetical protein